MSNTLTLVLDGKNVSLSAFTDAVTRFRGLVDTITRDVSGGRPVEWTVDNLDTSSAIVGVRGAGEEVVVDAIVRQYEQVGRALQAGRVDQIPVAVREHAFSLAEVLADPSVDAVRIETENADSIVTQVSRVAMIEHRPLVFIPRQAFEAYGAVEGRVQTLSSRNAYRFTLYDTVNDKAVSCYLAPTDENVMRDAWGRLALVEGIVRRDGETGRPLTVRQVERVMLLPERPQGGWRAARGVAPATSDVLPEQAIRKLRDAD